MTMFELVVDNDDMRDDVLPFTCGWESHVRRDRPYVVVCEPWEAPTRVVSSHKTESAALKAAAKANHEFRERYPTGFGYSWDAAKVIR